MSSAGLLFLELYFLWINIGKSWDLPAECRRSPPKPQPLPPIDPIRPNADRHTHATHMMNTTESSSTTASSTSTTNTEWEAVCCAAIEIRYSMKDHDSQCGNLHDTLPSCVLNTNSKIEVINLRNCSLSGSIPSEFMYMTDLRMLDIRDNSVSGSIPSYFNRYDLFPNLQKFHIANNNLDGKIPSNIFQYPQLTYIDMHNNKRLHFDITHLNLTASNGLNDKPAITANFSFLHIDLMNDTDISLYQFFENIRFAQFSMRSSVNNVSFVWKNRKAANVNQYHTLYATQTFDIYGNNISGEFPCNFESVPWEFYVANNFFTNWNISCYKSKHFKTLMIFQKEGAYNNQSNKCYHDFSSWSTSNDYNDYYSYCRSSRAPSALKECCIAMHKTTAAPTQTPTRAAKASNPPIMHWFLDHMEWVLLLLIMSVVVFAIVFYSLWRRNNGKYKKIKHIDTVHHNTTAMKVKHRTSTSDKESLLYGDF